MQVQRLRDAGERRVQALQVGLAVALLVLAALAERSTAASVQWPVLTLVLAGALVIERRQRAPGPLRAVTRSGGGLRPGRAKRFWSWLQRPISDGVVHGHEEGERCNDLCRRTGALDEPTPTFVPEPEPEPEPGPAPVPACAGVSRRCGQRGAARPRSPRDTGTRLSS